MRESRGFGMFMDIYLPCLLTETFYRICASIVGGGWEIRSHGKERTWLTARLGRY